MTRQHEVRAARAATRERSAAAFPRSAATAAHAPARMLPRHLGNQGAQAFATALPGETASLPKRYKPLLDRIRSEENPREDSVLTGHDLRVLYRLRTLALAVESGDVAGTKTAVTDFLVAAEENPLRPASAILLEDVPLTIVSRVFLLGLDPEWKRLEEHFFGKKHKLDYEQPTHHRGGHATRYEVLARISRDAIKRGASDDPRNAERGIDLILRAFQGVIDAVAAMDLKVVERDVARMREEAKSQSPQDYPAIQPGRNPDQNAGGHYLHLFTLLPPLITAMQRNYQALLEEAIVELEVGNAACLKNLRVILEQKIGPVVTAHPKLLLPDMVVDVEVTKSDFEHRQKKHLDVFQPRKESAAVIIEAFDKDAIFFNEKRLTLESVLKARERQISALERIYDAGFAAGTGKDAAESGRKPAVKASDRLKLHDNDRWREFLLRTFQANRKKGDWQALEATIEVLQTYLGAFTISTPFNIAEMDPNYLTRTFPRALTGQLIHDCGVYALRVAYALSLVRRELNLTFRAIALPVHLGLIISFGDDLARGAILVHNNRLIRVSGGELLEAERRWLTTDAAGKKEVHPRKPEAKAFLAGAAAGRFIERVDVPYELAAVPKVPVRDEIEKTHYQALWTFHKDEASRKQPIRPTKKVRQPELLYLDILHRTKELHNGWRVPLYRQEYQRLQQDGKMLEAARADSKSSDPAKVRAAREILHGYEQKLRKRFLPLTSGIADLEARRLQIDEFLKANPEAVAEKAVIARWRRLVLTDWQSIEQQLIDYLGDEARGGVLSRGDETAAPWSDQDKLPQYLDY